MSAAKSEGPYVTRAGLKLAAALSEFDISPAGRTCLDLGSHAGGFVDCLLQHGAAKVFAVDPGYGVLDLRLRHDPRVQVFERTNALTFVAPEPYELVTIDVGWTQQRLILPAARRSLNTGGRIITLIKPHYEAPGETKAGILPAEKIPELLQQVRGDLSELGFQILREMESPLRGHAGNTEYLWLVSASA